MGTSVQSGERKEKGRERRERREERGEWVSCTKKGIFVPFPNNNIISIGKRNNFLKMIYHPNKNNFFK